MTENSEHKDKATTGTPPAPEGYRWLDPAEDQIQPGDIRISNMQPAPNRLHGRIPRPYRLLRPLHRDTPQAPSQAPEGYRWLDPDADTIQPGDIRVWDMKSVSVRIHGRIPAPYRLLRPIPVPPPGTRWLDIREELHPSDRSKNGDAPGHGWSVLSQYFWYRPITLQGIEGLHAAEADPEGWEVSCNSGHSWEQDWRAFGYSLLTHEQTLWRRRAPESVDPLTQIKLQPGERIERKSDGSICVSVGGIHNLLSLDQSPRRWELCLEVLRVLEAEQKAKS